MQLRAIDVAGAPVARPVDTRRQRPPRVPDAHVGRPLVARDHGLGQRTVTLVCAPAGYGKTTIVADWAWSTDQAQRVTWVNLEARHNDPVRFWAAIVAALAEVCTGDLGQVLVRLRPPRSGEDGAFTDVLIEALDAMSETVWLVLDDVHKLTDPGVLRALETLLTGAPDGLSGRQDAGQVLERLSRANALVLQMADPTVYRYHSILRTYLAAELTKRAPARLLRQHMVTADWLIGKPSYAAALSHSVASGDENHLVRLIERNGIRMIHSGKGGRLLAAAREAKLPLDRLPFDRCDGRAGCPRCR